MRTAIAATTKDQRRAWSARIEEYVTGLPEWRESQTVLAFLSMDGEVDTSGMLKKALAAKKTVAVPRMYSRTIKFHRIESGKGPWEHHPFGVREPPETLPVIDPCADNTGEVLVITPGLCFDDNGTRLGFGKGYYDRLLERCRRRKTKIYFAAVCFSIQLIDEVPSDVHDCPVDVIITENGITYPRPSV